MAEGPLADVVAVLKSHFDKDPTELVLAFEVESGRQIDFDLRGSLADVIERAVPAKAAGPGRPRLGVVSREVSLLPRHWEWLETQANGSSAALRRLVEHAMKHEPPRERAHRARAALAKVLTAIAGDRPHFEEATRALYAGEVERFVELVHRWPRDIRDYGLARLRAAAELERTT